MRECTHLPCLWPHRCPRHRDHFVTSSTPFLARSGLEALATVRVEEDTGAVPRSATGSVAFGRNGLSSSNGRLVRNRPFAHSDRFPGHKGTGNAGCLLHPRSRVQDALKNAHTSIQVQPEQPGIPCTMVLRLMPSSPRRRIRLASVASELTVRIARLSFANLRRLDASHGQQDHTVLPYAASTAKNFNQPSAGQPKIWRRRLSAVRLRAMFAHGKPALRTPFAPDAAASTATRPNVRDDGQRPS